ncbi:type III-B CRISPR module-associated Cmr3 family protein [Actinomadura sp. 7K507]|uniref:type III-B CRISPR module-associated Cmr3 family protein n=1 Tax=Actinomadura sp. 7K507 TaxID=2530365 RepID=UPI001404E288|nr:type III-B CRISPR module-associated Cmr3 family protein [Actinomadura sp. 7K507]
MVLEPLDTVIVRDGRAFDAGVQSQSRTVPPTPTTMAGAIGAAYGAAPGAARSGSDSRGRDLPSHVQGPFAAYRNGDEWQGWWPVPADVITVNDDVERLSLVTPGDAEHDLSGEVELLLDDGGQDGEPLTGWWDEQSLTEYLHDGWVSRPITGEPWQTERRVGLAREDDRTAKDSMLYSAEHLRFAHGYGLAARCLGGPAHPLAGMVNLGGRGKRAQVHEVPDITVPEPPGDIDGGRLLLYLATPAIFPGGGWRPDLSRWPGTTLVAAALGRPQVVTTATPRRSQGSVGDGLLMWAVPAGSVYYLQFPSEAAAAKAAESLRYEPLDQHLINDRNWLSTAGFGLVFTGRWDAP